MIKLLKEKLIEISDTDLNLLYSYYRQLPDLLITEGFSDIILQFITNDAFDGRKYASVGSEVLISRECKLAHYENPIMIEFVMSSENSGYDPLNNTITIAVNREVLKQIVKVLQEQGIDVYAPFNTREFYDLISQDKAYWIEHLDLIFTEDIKTVLYHGLLHWIDDTQHNRFMVPIATLKNILDVESYTEYLIQKYHTKFEPFSYYEINAQIHMLYERSRSRRDWNSLTIYEVVQITPGLNHLFRLIKTHTSQDEQKEWIKSLMKLMHREGFLGDNMNYIPKTTAIMQEQKICAHGYPLIRETQLRENLTA